MIDDGFLEVYKNEFGRESYQVGSFCKRYRLTQLINDMEWRAVKYSTRDFSTTSKVATFYMKGWDQIDFELFEMLQQFHLDAIPFFENTDCNNFQNSEYPEVSIIKEISERKVAKNEDKKRSRRKEFTIKVSMKELYNFHMDSYRAIREGGSALRHTKDDYGRRHTNITNLPKWLRKKLYVIKDGKERYLEEVDVKNSQVLLLLTILDSSIAGYGEFKEKVEAGTFYEFLGEPLGFMLPLSDNDRAITKQQFFKFIYGYDENYVWDGEVGKVMKASFPALFDFIREFNEKYGYEKLAQEMQRAESDIIIQHVVKEALKRGLLFTQVYDSILCLPEDVDTFNTLIKEAYRNKGMAAKTNIDIRAATQPHTIFSINSVPEYISTESSKCAYGSKSIKKEQSHEWETPILVDGRKIDYRNPKKG